MSEFAKVFSQPADQLFRAVTRDGSRSAAPIETSLAAGVAAADALQTSGFNANHAALRQAIGPIDEREIGRMRLVPVGDASGLGGATPKQIVQDAQGRRYLAKAGDAKAVAEDLALQLRRRVGYPAAPVATHDVTLADGTTVTMRIKPLLANQGNLHGGPQAWPKAYQDTLLEDYAFAQLLGNFDLKKGQYIVLDTAKGKQILNTDWDNTLRDYGQAVPLTRYKAHDPNTLSPTAQSMLFADYVRGGQALDFKPLWQAIDRIQATPDEDLLHRLTPQQAAEYRTRKATLETTFTAFVRDLQAERAKNLGLAAEDRSLGERVGSNLKDAKLRATDYLTAETPYLVWKNRLVRPFKHH